MDIQIGLYKHTGFVSKVIQFFTWSKYSHVAIKIDGVVYESMYPYGVVKSNGWFGIHYENKPTIEVYKIDGTSGDYKTKENICRFLELHIGKKYDLPGLLGFVTRNSTLEKKDKWFCSELVFEALSRNGIFLLKNIEACKVTPGMIALSPLLTYVETLTVD